MTASRESTSTKPTLHIVLRVPRARFFVVATVCGALGVALIGFVRPRHLPAGGGVMLGGLLLCLALAFVVTTRLFPADFSIVVAEGTLRLPVRHRQWVHPVTREVPRTEIVAVGYNAHGDHLVVRTRSERLLVPWYWLPRRRPPKTVATDIAGALAVPLAQSI
jgi:hypothetical protein